MYRCQDEESDASNDMIEPKVKCPLFVQCVIHGAYAPRHFTLDHHPRTRNAKIECKLSMWLCYEMQGQCTSLHTPHAAVGFVADIGNSQKRLLASPNQDRGGNRRSSKELMKVFCVRVVRLIVIVISRATMAREIHTCQFVVGVDPQQVVLVQKPEARHHGHCHPQENHQNRHELRGEQIAAPAQEVAVAPAWPVCLEHVLLVGEEAREEQPPCPAAAVQLRRLQRIVVLEHVRHVIEAHEHPGRPEAAEQRSPGVDHGAAGRDSSEAPEQAIAHINHVPVAPGQRGSDAGAGDSGPVALEVRPVIRHQDFDERSRVEPEPPEPEEETAEHDERRVVPLHVHAGRAVAGEFADARSLDVRPPEARDAAHHVDDAAAREVDGAHAEQPRGAGGAQPAVDRPHPVRDDGVHEAAAGDAGGGDGERPLEEEEAVVESVRSVGDVVQAEEIAADERIVVLAAPEGEAESEQIERDASRGCVQDIGHHDVHGVFGPHRARAQHGEANLHREDEVGREEQVHIVDGQRVARESVGHAAQLGAQEFSDLDRTCRAETSREQQIDEEALLIFDARRRHGCCTLGPSSVRELLSELAAYCTTEGPSCAAARDERWEISSSEHRGLGSLISFPPARPFESDRSRLCSMRFISDSTCQAHDRCLSRASEGSVGCWRFGAPNTLFHIGPGRVARLILIIASPCESKRDPEPARCPPDPSGRV
ncbi:hypothetical protein MARPO_0023s0005 [Marchantia polymorpha]|uniref:Uncharacterized protein n=1 Tax=Marchantia polymorpha TaxID=3197 RepID=A0A2R6XC19_MARPO|nr:hypothetical protein MARPO_0023s0005 [Marchantia polymorpha]|eukprot:PTQ43661.1 hypothetical protein MARPO_0023s0005 [Marchantia polymorpha]